MSAKTKMVRSKCSLGLSIFLLILYITVVQAQCPNQCFTAQNAVNYFCDLVGGQNCEVSNCVTDNNNGYKCDKTPTACPNTCHSSRELAEHECASMPENLYCIPQKCGSSGRFQCARARPAWGRCYGDPHCQSYDHRSWGANFDCHGQGEYILTKSGSNPRFEVQSGFANDETFRQGSWSDQIAFAVSFAGKPTIQVERTGSMPAGVLWNLNYCGTLIRVGGVQINNIPPFPQTFSRQISPGIWLMRYRIGSKSMLRLTFIDGNYYMVVVSQEWRWAGMCTLWEVRVILSGSIVASSSGITGLLGIPNGIVEDDFHDTAGNQIQTGGFDKTGYCRNNWCNRKEADSLFTYNPGTNFNTFMKCDSVIGVNERFSVRQVQSNVNAKAISAICRGDRACEFDGAIGGVAEAAHFVNNDRVSQADARVNSDPAASPRPVHPPEFISVPPTPTPTPIIAPACTQSDCFKFPPVEKCLAWCSKNQVVSNPGLGLSA